MPPKRLRRNLYRPEPWCVGGRPSNGFLGRRSAPHSPRVRPNTLKWQKASTRHFSCGPCGVSSCLILGIRSSWFWGQQRCDSVGGRPGHQLELEAHRREPPLPAKTCRERRVWNLARTVEVPARRFLDQTPCQGYLYFPQELYNEHELMLDWRGRSEFWYFIMWFLSWLAARNSGILWSLSWFTARNSGFWCDFWVDL